MAAPARSADEREESSTPNVYLEPGIALSDEFNDIAELAAYVCTTPIAALSLIVDNRQYHRALVGVDRSQSNIEFDFSSRVIESRSCMAIENAAEDPCFAEMPLVADEPGLRFYAGVPLVSADGSILGVLSVMDRKPRRIAARAMDALQRLARQASALVDAERRLAQVETLIADREESEKALQTERDFQTAVMESLQDGIVSCDAQGTLSRFNSATRRFHGRSESPLPPEVWAEHFGLYHGDGQTPLKMEDVPLYRALQGEELNGIEFCILPKDGEMRTLLATGKAIMNKAGEKLGAVIAMHDVTAYKVLERALREREQALRAVLESAPIILYAVDANGRVTLSEGKGLAALGLDPGEAVGRGVWEFSGGHSDSDAYTRLALAGQEVSYDIEIYGLWLHTHLKPILTETGENDGFIGVCVDVTERVASEEKFRVLFECSPQAHLIFDENSGITECNAAALRLMRSPDKQRVLGIRPASLSPEILPNGRSSGELHSEMCALAKAEGSVRFEWPCRAMDGYEFPIEVTLTPITIGGKQLILSVWHDLSQRKDQEKLINDHALALEFQAQELERANAELATLATTDGLTNLTNHRAFQIRLAEEFNRAVRYKTSLSLILLDVDHFKEYNDMFGHQAGDATLRAIGQIVKNEARDTDVVARYGGEELAVILPYADLSAAAEAADRMRVAIERHQWPIRLVTASFGVASLRMYEKDVADLISRADAALYRAKHSGRNRVSADSPFTVSHPA